MKRKRASNYRYVTYRHPDNASRKAAGYYVQKCSSRDSEYMEHGPFQEEMQAVAHAAKVFKVAPESLKRDSGGQAPLAQAVQGPRSKAQGPITKEVSKYRFVTRRTLRGSTYWVAQPGKRRQKLFKTQEDAVAWVAKQRKASVANLRKGKTLHKYCTQYHKRLAAVVSIYGGGSEVPGDVQYLRTHATSSEKVFVKEPALEILDVQAKYGPFRAALIRCFQASHPWSEVRGHTELHKKYGMQTVCRAVRLSSVLCQTLQVIEGQDFGIWVENCGCNVSHHSGFVPMLMRFKLLRKAVAGERRTLKLSSVSGQRYVIAQGNTTQVLCNLCEVISLADAMRKTLSSVPGPRSCATWCKAFHAMRGVLRDYTCPGMRDQTSYLPLWTIRAMMMRRMYIQGLSRIRADNSSWEEFTKTFPDQKGMFKRIIPATLIRQIGKVSCVEMFKHSGYKGPPELMSMYLCFCGAIEEASTKFLDENLPALMRTRRGYKEKYKQNPVLMVLVKMIQ